MACAKECARTRRVDEDQTRFQLIGAANVKEEKQMAIRRSCWTLQSGQEKFRQTGRRRDKGTTEVNEEGNTRRSEAPRCLGPAFMP